MNKERASPDRKRTLLDGMMKIGTAVFETFQKPCWQATATRVGRDGEESVPPLMARESQPEEENGFWPNHAPPRTEAGGGVQPDLSIYYRPSVPLRAATASSSR